MMSKENPTTEELHEAILFVANYALKQGSALMKRQVTFDMSTSEAELKGVVYICLDENLFPELDSAILAVAERRGLMRIPEKPQKKH